MKSILFDETFRCGSWLSGKFKISEPYDEIYVEILLQLENFWTNNKSFVKSSTGNSSHFRLLKPIYLHFPVIR